MKVLNFALSALAFTTSSHAISTSLNGARKTIGDLRREAEARKARLVKRDTDPSLLYPEHNFTTPIDHFHNETKYEPHSNGTYPMRYWFDATYYEPGGPVIVLQSGETDASSRLVYLQKGILHDLAKATNGVGVVMEHRYYGTSFPVPDLSTKNLRFLTTQQALADATYFAQNIKFPGLEQYDLTSNSTAYIGYGGSYSGAFNAFLRVQYPDVWWGTISSSGVTKAIYDYWQYWAPIAEYGPPACIAAQKTITHVVDNILIGKNNTDLTAQLKAAFGMPNVTYDTDFANALTGGIGNWQSLNWDPAVSNPEVYRYCANISDTDVLYPATEALRNESAYLISQGGYSANSSLVTQILNYIGYVNLTAVAPCARRGGTQDECFSNHNATYYEQHSLDDSWRSWPYQYCTEWGYLQTGSGWPKGRGDGLPLISRTLDLEYNSIICRDAFGIYGPPNLATVNKYGGYDISYPRLAIIDGEWDPWRPATPHAFGYGAHDRESNASEPFFMIDNAVHHYDENGLFWNQTTTTFPPLPVADAQKAEVIFVQEWMQEWTLHKLTKASGYSQRVIG